MSDLRELQRLDDLRSDLVGRHEDAMSRLAATHLRAVAAGHFELAVDCAEALNTLWESREANPDLFTDRKDYA
jgi:hypothetical protein